MTVTEKLRALGYTDKEIRKVNKRLNRFSSIKFAEVVEVAATSYGPDGMMVEMYV